MRVRHGFPQLLTAPHRTPSLLQWNGQARMQSVRRRPSWSPRMTEQPSFRHLLKRYRQAAGLSQEALAARAGLSARAISDLERGVYRRPRFDTLQLLLGALALPEPQQALLRVAAEPEQATRVPEGREAPPALKSLPLASLPLIGRAAERAQLPRLVQRAEG